MKKTIWVLLIVFFVVLALAFGACGSRGTEGLVYNISIDGASYAVTDYDGDATEVVIPAKYKNKPVVRIEDFAFSDCHSVMSITLSNSVTSIGDFAFSKCYSLTSITIPDSVTAIEDSSFYGCGSLTSITIGNGVTSIGKYAFLNCRSLASVTIGESLTSIGEVAFNGCSALTSVYYKGTASKWENITISRNNTSLTSATRYYYSETQPTEVGNFWHYGANGEIVIW